MLGGVVTLGGGVLNCWAKKQKSVALSSWESELFANHHAGHEIIWDPERVDGSWVQLQVSQLRQTVRVSLITRDAVATALRRNTLV